MIDPHDAQAFARHYYYDAQKKGDDTGKPLAFLGAVTICIGAKMIWDGVGRDWASKVMNSRAAGRHK